VTTIITIVAQFGC